MASVAKREWKGPSGEDLSAWVVRYTDDRGKRRLKTFDKKKDADKFRTQVETELEKGTHVADAETMTFDKAAHDYLKDCERRHTNLGKPSRSTLLSTQWAFINHLIPRFGRTKLTAIDPATVQDWLDDQSGERSHDTIQHFRMHLNQLATFAIKKRWLKKSPFQDHKLKVNKKKTAIVIPTKEQVAKLFATLNVRGWREHDKNFYQRRAFMSLAAVGGLRLGEVCGLKWKHVRFDRDVIEIRHCYTRINGWRPPKSDHIRDVDMDPSIRTTLEALLPFRGPDEEIVFSCKLSGKPWDTQHVHSAIWRRLLVRAGLMGHINDTPPFHIHALRHFNVSLLIALGADPVMIARHVGHQKVSTTLNTYGHLFPGDSRVRASLRTIGQNIGATWEQHKLLTN